MEKNPVCIYPEKIMQPVSLKNKLVVCVLAGLIPAFTLQRIVFRTIWEFGHGLVPPLLLAAIPMLAILLAALIFGFSWHRREKRAGATPSRNLNILQGIIRFFIALNLSMIGWQKIFHLQFFTPLAVLDQPFSSFSGEALTWAYFGHSYPFVFVVGFFQIAGSYLLLFKRTGLFGCFLLFPVMLDIVCLDLFYGFEPGERWQATLLLLAILYLILQDYERLKLFFFRPVEGAGPWKSGKRWVITAFRLAVVVIPLLLLSSYPPRDLYPQHTGKYLVAGLSVNHQAVRADNCADSVLTTIYLDQGGELVFEYHSQLRRFIGAYRFDKETHRFRAGWRYPKSQPDFDGWLNEEKPGVFHLSGRMGKDSLSADLIRQN